jgi:hypothetical protein
MNAILLTGTVVVGRLEPNLKDGRVAGFSLLANNVELLSTSPPNNAAVTHTLAESSR